MACRTISKIHGFADVSYRLDSFYPPYRFSVDFFRASAPFESTFSYFFQSLTMEDNIIGSFVGVFFLILSELYMTRILNKTNGY